MKNLVASPRSKYLFFLGILALGIGVISKKVISYPTECSPMNNQEITFIFKAWRNSINFIGIKGVLIAIKGILIINKQKMQLDLYKATQAKIYLP